jgi:hypothetical protein
MSNLILKDVVGLRSTACICLMPTPYVLPKTHCMCLILDLVDMPVLGLVHMTGLRPSAHDRP